ncbi:GGDEF domain-containing protein [Frankia sp. CcI49]|uniref:GGDEF domain-containing protein n=1 Tax=Frankia sp. CcI49 TaxID=1745382 RepID=UPI001F519E0F|nr:GGDEF domain-containing protein [Frankia sp. CcI49]
MTAPRAMRPSSDRRWALALGGGIGLLVVFWALSAAGTVSAGRTAVELLAGVCATAAVCVGVRRHRPAATLPWWLFAAAQATATVGDSLLYGIGNLLDRHRFPGLWDVCYLAQYPLLVAGVVVLARRRGLPGGLTDVLDSATIGVAGALVAWVYVIAPGLSAEHSSSFATRVTALAYAASFPALFAAGLLLVLDRGRRGPAGYLLLTHLSAVLAASLLYLPRQIDGTDQFGGGAQLVALLGALGLGGAALHPSMRELTSTRKRSTAVLSTSRLLALTAAALVAPIVLTVQSVRGETDGLVVVAVSSGAMFVLIIFRMAGLVADQHQAAITDGLTGVHTRRHLDGELSAAVDRALREGHRLGLFLIDVDHFKSINDRFGHPVGDDVLVEVARRLRAATRPGDVLGRYGGEEFAVLVTDLPEIDLAAVGERLRRQVCATPIRVGTRSPGGHLDPPGRRTDPPRPGDGPRPAVEQLVAVTVSVGAAAIPTHAADTFGLVAAADSALYAAKSAGRDQVAVSGTIGAPADGDQLAVSGAAEAL